MTRTLFSLAAIAALLTASASAQNKPNFDINNLPTKWEDCKSGCNQCKKMGPNSVIGGAKEESVVSYCLKSGYGTRLITNSAIQGVQFLKTPNLLQVTGVGNFTGLNIQRGDAGGELDPHDADGTGNPKGGLVYSNNVPGSEGKWTQIKEWNNFMSDYEFSFRAAYGPNADKWAPHIYDAMGAYYNTNGAKFQKGSFEDCEGDSGEFIGIYGSSTFRQGQGQKQTRAPHPPAKSYNCKAYRTVANGPAPQKPYRRSVAKPL
ncbi:uncharacterized protein UBRO_04603 [Ustilago bromivora]|uniref:Uncharacterized protein n=1 Tax=Ustilago bromivora TaxID=307758 RepID=A0A1K0H7K8_9BASI|nr:uncharacterized protein UBRO_04603 [Ustilago bromivora]